MLLCFVCLGFLFIVCLFLIFLQMKWIYRFLKIDFFISRYMRNRLMKFVIKKACSGGLRLGHIEHLGRLGNRSAETPMCVLYTRGGKHLCFILIYLI